MRLRRHGAILALLLTAALMLLSQGRAGATTQTTVTVGKYTVQNTLTGQKTHYLPARTVGATNVYTGTGNQPYLHSNGQVQRLTIPIIVYWPGSSSQGYSFPVPPSGSLYPSYISDTESFWYAAHNETQYYGTTGTPISVLKAYNGQYEGTPLNYSGYVYTPTVVLDSQAFPTSDCTDGTTTYCLTQNDINTEITRLATLYGVNTGLDPSIDYDWVIYTPPNVGQCFDTSSSSCTYSTWCAYHSAVLAGNGFPIVIDQPYPADGSGSLNECGSLNTGGSFGPYGNAFSAAANNTVWHELAESATDPRFDAWRGDDGNEIGDAYAWVFPTPLGSLGAFYGPYNSYFAFPKSGGGTGYYLMYVQCVMRASDGGCALTS